MTTRRRAIPLAVAIAAAAACTDTNITGTRPAAEGEGVILFASNRADNNFEIYRVGTAGGDLRRLTNDRVNNDLSPAASRDGRRIAWEKEILASNGSITGVEIWVMGVDGSDPRAVVSNGSENRNPSWTRGDSALVFESRVSGNSEIMRVAATGGTPVNLSRNSFADQHPRVSPDGASVLFHSNRDLNFEIYVMGSDGSNPRNLSSNPADDRYPAWIPDGTGIVWSRFTDSFDIFRMDATGANQRAIASSSFEETNPSVSPDGSAVVYQTNRFPRSSLDVAQLSEQSARALTGNASRAAVSDVTPWWAVAGR